MTRKLTAVQTSAGKGTRSRPLSLSSLTSMIPKGLMRIMGLYIAEIQLEQFKAAGIKEVYVVTQYFDNREYVSMRFSDGIQQFGLRIYYSNPALDYSNAGSGDAILTNIEANQLEGHSIWLPNDNLFEFDAHKVIQDHRDLGAVVSIMTTWMNPRQTIGNYGLIRTDAHHRATTIIEKPENESDVLKALELKVPNELDNMRVHVNTGGYVLNNDALAGIAKESWVSKARKMPNAEFDMAGSLVKGLIERDYPVYAVSIDKWGDFGSTSFFLDTFPDALSGLFPSITKILETRGYYHDASRNVWIHPETLESKDKNEKTLKERIETGNVKVGPNVFIDKGVVIGDDAEIRYSDLEKHVQIGKSVVVDRAYLSHYCNVGPYAYLRETALGRDVKVDSSKKSSTHIDGRSILGPQIYVPQGTNLDNVVIFPGYRFEGPGEVHSNERLVPSDEQILTIVKTYQNS